ncbi:MAG TPA: acyl-CoA dehydrogenase [Kofleriaceae bacterium]|jgi:alkylation response protein AidB-like acyl-CoA dehydrogenase
MDAEAIAKHARARFAAYVNEHVNPGSDERDRAGTTFSREMLREAARAGLWGLGMPKACGGGGANAFEWGIALEQLGYLADDGSFPLVVSIRAAIANAIHNAGRADLDERYVQPMVRCELFGSFAYSDGADPFAFNSHAERDGKDWIAHGEKLLVTGGASADVFMTYLRLQGSGDLIVLLIEANDPGVSVTPVDVTGLRAAGLSSLKLDGVRIPAERVLCDEDGVSHAQRFLNERRTLLACGALGRMQAVFEMCIDSLDQTVRYGKQLVEMQNVQATFGRMYAGIESARALTHFSLRRQAGLAPGFDPMFDPIGAAAKYTISERAIEISTRAFRLLGGKGYVRDQRIERYVRDFYGLLAGGGSQDVLEVDLGIDAISHYHRMKQAR